MSTEFNPISGRHHHDANLNCLQLNLIKHEQPCIIDDKVFSHEKGGNVALPKDDFANNVLNKVSNFNDFDVREFEKIFKVIELIMRV